MSTMSGPGQQQEVAHTMGSGRVHAMRIEQSMLPLRVLGRYVVAGDGRTRVKLSCVNWGGAQLSKRVPAGLHLRTPEYLAGALAEIGFNCVRLVYALQPLGVGDVDPFWVGNAAASQDEWVNPSLHALTAVQVMDRVVLACVTAGLAVILNNHNSDSGWCCSDDDHNGLWWNSRYPTRNWLEHVRNFTERYSSPDFGGMVIGFDLRNEIRSTRVAGRWYRARWGVNGDGVEDWREAAVEASNYVLQNSQMLVIVEGIQYATVLCMLADDPVPQWMANRTLYSAHEYSWTQMGYMVPEKTLEFLWSPTTASAIMLWQLVIIFCTTFFFRRRCPHKQWTCWVPVILCWLMGVFVVLLSTFSQWGDCSRNWRAAIVASEMIGWTIGLNGTCCLVCLLLTRLYTQRRLRLHSCSKVRELQLMGFGAQSDPDPELHYHLHSEGEMGQEDQSIIGHGQSWHSLLFFSLLLLPPALCVSGVIVRGIHSTQWAYQREMDRKWGHLLTANPPRPVWIGEYGPGSESADRSWQFDYFLSNDVDLAYWQMAGENGLLFDGSFAYEKYGIFGIDYNLSNLTPWQPVQVMDLIRQTFVPRVTLVESGGEREYSG